jgi:hypothetical protein
LAFRWNPTMMPRNHFAQNELRVPTRMAYFRCQQKKEVLFLLSID